MKFKKLALFLASAVLPVIAYTVQAKSYTSYDPVPLSTIYPIKDDSARALIALAAIYAPTEDEAGWMRLVCAGMTEGGCAYFKENQAFDLKKSQSSNIGSSSGFIANVKTISEKLLAKQNITNSLLPFRTNFQKYLSQFLCLVNWNFCYKTIQ